MEENKNVVEEVVPETPELNEDGTVRDTAYEQEQMQYSTFRYGLGAVLAFFGFSSKTHRASKKRAKLVADIATYIILLFGSFLMVYPFWWMIAGSFAYAPDSTYVNTFKEMVWWPKISVITAMENPEIGGSLVKGGLFYNYYQVFVRVFDGSLNTQLHPKFTYWRAIINNLFYSVVPVVVGVITSASAAFSFAKIQWIGRNKVFMFLLAAIMVPGAALTSAQYVIYHTFGWINSWEVLVIPGLFGSIMTAFFIRQFLYGMPTSIIEAAKIDGAGYFRIFCSFILPLAMPAIMAQGLLSFMGAWNNYMGSYLFIDPKSEWINLPHAMYLLQNNYYSGSVTSQVVAASVLCVAPVLILFAIFQRQIIGSLMLTGSKE